jgi:hypothetical protein
VKKKKTSAAAFVPMASQAIALPKALPPVTSTMMANAKAPIHDIPPTQQFYVPPAPTQDPEAMFVDGDLHELMEDAVFLLANVPTTTTTTNTAAAAAATTTTTSSAAAAAAVAASARATSSSTRRSRQDHCDPSSAAEAGLSVIDMTLPLTREELFSMARIIAESCSTLESVANTAPLRELLEATILFTEDSYPSNRNDVIANIAKLQNMLGGLHSCEDTRNKQVADARTTMAGDTFRKAYAKVANTLLTRTTYAKTVMTISKDGVMSQLFVKGGEKYVQKNKTTRPIKTIRKTNAQYYRFFQYLGGGDVTTLVEECPLKWKGEKGKKVPGLMEAANLLRRKSPTSHGEYLTVLIIVVLSVVLGPKTNDSVYRVSRLYEIVEKIAGGGAQPVVRIVDFLKEIPVPLWNRALARCMKVAGTKSDSEEKLMKTISERWVDVAKIHVGGSFKIKCVLPAFKKGQVDKKAAAISSSRATMALYEKTSADKGTVEDTIVTGTHSGDDGNDDEGDGDDGGGKSGGDSSDDDESSESSDF